MSIICLICKEKLLNCAPGSSPGSLNNLVENEVVATGCGHLYHYFCVQSWFRTQKKKMINQGITGNMPDNCPTCQNEVDDSQIRRVYLLEDHRDSLEKAKMLEKMENLEIYCHQLEVHLNQLRSENDLLLNKALTPSKKLGNDDFAAIVKNDKVIWLKKDSPPLSGIVLSIFKKDKVLWVKLKLDKKIRNNHRPGLFGSFRFDKNKEITVPFDEIVLEKDYQNDSIIDENNISGASTPTSPTVKFSPQTTPSFRNSTLSLPGEYLNQNNFYNGRRNAHGLYPIGSYDFINNLGSVNSVHFPYDGLYNFPEEPRMVSSNPTIVPMNVMEESNANNFQNITEDDQRDYVILPENNNASHHSLNSRANSSENATLPTSHSPTSQESKKHVTFADELARKPSDLKDRSKGNHFRDHDYKNVSEMPMSIQDKVNFMTGDADASSLKYLRVSKVDVDEDESMSLEQIPSIHLVEPSEEISTPLSQVELQTATLNEELTVSNEDRAFNQSCFDITLATLFLECQIFDESLLNRSVPNDQIQTAVQTIIKENFVRPLRDSRKYQVGYSVRLYEVISHLCSSCLDLEELMTILFEYVFKIPPFISYSYEMCDYIHQFFIDFTDKAKTPSVQQLLERSLTLQDNLKLLGEPSPALFLQMPNSEDGIIHYDAVIPSLTLNLEHILERDAVKTEALACYCNKTATLECATCAKIHGKSPVLFCEDCSVLLEAIHDQMYHKLALVPIKALKIPSTVFDLCGIICLKGSSYSAFLRNRDELESKWFFIEEFNKGIPKIVNLPKLEKWIESVGSNPSDLELNYVNNFQRKLLTECRMFLYLPVKNSFA